MTVPTGPSPSRLDASPFGALNPLLPEPEPAHHETCCRKIGRDSRASPTKSACLPLRPSPRVATFQRARYPRASMNELSRHQLVLEPDDGERLANLCGPLDEHLRQIELRLGVEIANRGNIFRVTGADHSAKLTERVLPEPYDATGEETLTGAQINLRLSESGIDALDVRAAAGAHEVAIRVKRGTIRGRGANQTRYLHAIAAHDINFGVGPAGTGKTWLAVAMAVDALNDNRVQRLILVRPAVEAGEKLGFLPGDLTQKVDPYLRPLYDAPYEMLGIE